MKRFSLKSLAVLKSKLCGWVGSAGGSQHLTHSKLGSLIAEILQSHPHLGVDKLFLQLSSLPIRFAWCRPAGFHTKPSSIYHAMWDCQQQLVDITTAFPSTGNRVSYC